MASTVPAKSQSLHNFTLPHLKWNKDGHSGGHHQRRRSVKSPSGRPNASSASPVRHSPLRDSVSATPPRHQSPLSDFQAMPSPRDSPARRDYLGKQSSTHGEPPAPFPFREWVKRSATSVDPPPPPLHRHGLASESNTFAELKRLVEYQRLHSKNLKLDTARNGVSSSNPDRGPHKIEKKSNDFAEFKSNLVEYERFRSKNLKLDTATNGVSSSNPDRGPHKLEKKSKAKEVDATGIKRSKKILIKIPCKSNKLDEESPQREPLKTDTKDEADETDEGREQGNINNNTDEETKIWNLRPRKSIRTLPSVNGGPVKNNGSAMPERHKGQSPLRNLSNNKPGGNGGSCGGGRGDLKKGSDKKEKRKLSVSLSLSKDEIEEDIFSLTGSKPARRPKKRAKIIQRQINSLFPGSWLVSISADSYKVSEKFT
ncbi:hypothetical protein OROHE_004927 [Orobanche hederae]